MIKPISPKDIVAVQRLQLGEAVFTVVNRLIAVNFAGDRANFTQDAVVAALVATGMTRKEIFDKGLLNFEDSYRAKGWTVHYDRPGYNEFYAANFTFIRKPSNK